MATEKEQATGSSIVTAKQIDYHQKVFSHPTYQFQTVYPNTFGTPIPLDASQNICTMVLPPEVFNLSESYLTFTQTLTTPTAGNYIWTPEDVFSGCFNHIQFYPSNNQYIADIDNLTNYMKV